MHRTLLGGLFAAIAVSATVGCSSPATVTRAQSPGIQQVGHHSHGPLCDGNCLGHGGGSFGAFGGGFGGGSCRPAHGMSTMHNCPIGSPGCPTGCWDGGWGGEETGFLGRKYERTFVAPQNLKYPPQNVPPTVIQYPYYTLRGPTDFFMK